MTHSGGKQHSVGYQGQRYEVSAFDEGENARRVIGWTDDAKTASRMATSAELRPGWSCAWVTDLTTDISHTKLAKWVGERPLPANVEFSGTPAALSPEAPLERRVGGAVPPAPTFGGTGK